MPELPDLQVIGKNLEKRLQHEKVEKVVLHKTKRIAASQNDFAAAFEGSSIRSISRDGKELTFDFENGNRLVVHLMREGRFALEDHESIGRYKILELFFGAGKYLALNDFMKQATARINPPKETVPDALAKTFTVDYLQNRLRIKRNSTIKAFLVDQKNIRGIGNAYADEILWATRIAPQSKCGKLPEKVVESLHGTIRQVLAQAEVQIREADPELVSGEIRDFLAVHRKDRSETPTGAAIIKAKVGGKSTYYTSEQTLFE